MHERQQKHLPQVKERKRERERERLQLSSLGISPIASMQAFQGREMKGALTEEIVEVKCGPKILSSFLGRVFAYSYVYKTSHHFHFRTSVGVEYKLCVLLQPMCHDYKVIIERLK